MNTHRWSQVALSLALLACSEDGGGPSRSTGGRDARGDEPTLPDDSPPPPRRGEVKLLGAGPNLPIASWSLVGPASGGAEDEATVSCSLTEHVAGTTLEVTGTSNSGLPRAALILRMSGLGPLSQDVTYEETAVEQPLGLEVSLPGPLQYVYGYAPLSTPVVRSSCNVVVTALDEANAVGQVACRNLVAKDKVEVGQASLTIAFDCPVVTHARPSPGPGGGGGGGNTGTGGTDPGKPGAGGSGGGSGPGESCRGVASPCSARTAATCSSVKGCTSGGECTGVSSSCYSQFSSYSCNSQQGCFWSSLNESCSGSAWSCSSMSGSATCTSQRGCSWDTTCEGVATSCSALSESECSSQPGCSWY